MKAIYITITEVEIDIIAKVADENWQRFGDC